MTCHSSALSVKQNAALSPNAASVASGGSSSSSQRQLATVSASSVEQQSATPAVVYVGEPRSCGAVVVERREFIAELWCTECMRWEPFASDNTWERIKGDASGLFPERLCRLLRDGVVVAVYRQTEEL